MSLGAAYPSHPIFAIEVQFGMFDPAPVAVIVREVLPFIMEPLARTVGGSRHHRATSAAFARVDFGLHGRAAGDRKATRG